MTFKRRLFLTSLVLVTLTSTALIGYFYWSATRQTVEKSRELLVNASHDLMKDLERFFAERQNDLAMMATARVWYDNSPQWYLKERLIRYRDYARVYDRISVLDGEGKVLGDSNGEEIGERLACRCWEEGTFHGQGYKLMYAEDLHTGSIHFFNSIQQKGWPSRILTARVPLSRINNIAAATETIRSAGFPRADLELISEDGRLLFSSAGDGGLNELVRDWPRYRSQIAAMRAGKRVESISEQAGTFTLLIRSTGEEGNPSIPLLIHIHADTATLYQEARQRGLEMAGIGLALTILSSLLVWLAVKQLSRPLHELVSHVVALEEGDFSQLDALAPRSDEFGILVERFRTMANRLKMSMGDLREAERQSQRIAQEWTRSFDAITDLVCILDADFRVRRINMSMASALAQRPQECIGRNCFDLLHGTDAPCADCQYIMAMKARKAMSSEYFNERLGRHLFITFVPLVTREGILEGAVYVAHDITQHKEAAEEIRRLNTDLEARVALRTHELEESNRDLEGFCYAISHELRAPIARLQGFAQALQEDVNDGVVDIPFYVERIGTASSQLQQVIVALLQLSRLSRAELDIGPVDLSRMVEEIGRDLLKGNPGREIELIIAPDVRVDGDIRLLWVCMENLMGNACKYTAHQHRAVIEFGYRNEGDHRILFVRDNGAGFDMVSASRLFQPFQRLHSEDDFPGTGVGLATVARVIERHGGKVWAEGAPGQGATFLFVLDGPQA